MTLPTLDIVIVNWNTGTYLRDCLRSVADSERTRFELGKIVVVDNASTDDSPRMVREEFPGVELLALDGAVDSSSLPLQIHRNDVNRGFGAACNQGARECSSDFLLLLNPDTRVFPDTIDTTVGFMLEPANAGVGICGGRMVNDDGSDEFSCWRFPTFWIWAAKITGLAHAFPRWVQLQRMTNDEVGGNGVVDQVIGEVHEKRRITDDAPLFAEVEA